MFLRMTILCFCLCGALRAQVPQETPASPPAKNQPKPSVTEHEPTTPPKAAEPPPAAAPHEPPSHVPTAASVAPPAHAANSVHPAKGPKPPNVRPAPPAPVPSAPREPPVAVPVIVSPSPAQLLLNALDLALRQSADHRQAADLAGLRVTKDKLQVSLSAGGDPADVSRQTAALFSQLYPPAAGGTVPPSDPPVQTPKQNNYVFLAILVSLLSPLICVAGFWCGAVVTQSKVRKGFREAGLL